MPSARTTFLNSPIRKYAEQSEIVELEPVGIVARNWGIISRVCRGAGNQMRKISEQEIGQTRFPAPPLEVSPGSDLAYVKNEMFDGRRHAQWKDSVRQRFRLSTKKFGVLEIADPHRLASTASVSVRFRQARQLHARY